MSFGSRLSSIPITGCISVAKSSAPLRTSSGIFTASSGTPSSNGSAFWQASTTHSARTNIGVKGGPPHGPGGNFGSLTFENGLSFVIKAPNPARRSLCFFLTSAVRLGSVLHAIRALMYSLAFLCRSDAWELMICGIKITPPAVYTVDADPNITE